jgi:hypothetical protein
MAFLGQELEPKGQKILGTPRCVKDLLEEPDPTKHRTRSSLPGTLDSRPRSSRQPIPIDHPLGNGLVQPGSNNRIRNEFRAWRIPLAGFRFP